MAAPKYNKQKPQLHCDHGNQVRESTAGFAVRMWTGKGQAEKRTTLSGESGRIMQLRTSFIPQPECVGADEHTHTYLHTHTASDLNFTPRWNIPTAELFLLWQIYMCLLMWHIAVVSKVTKQLFPLICKLSSIHCVVLLHIPVPV